MVKVDLHDERHRYVEIPVEAQLSCTWGQRADPTKGEVCLKKYGFNVSMRC